MGQRIKLIVLVQRAQLFPAWLILHGQRVMPLPFSKSKSSPRQPGRGPQDYAFGSTSYTSLPVPRSHAAFFISTSPPGSLHGPLPPPAWTPWGAQCSSPISQATPMGPTWLQSSSAALSCIHFSVQLSLCIYRVRTPLHGSGTGVLSHCGGSGTCTSKGYLHQMVLRT